MTYESFPLKKYGAINALAISIDNELLCVCQEGRGSRFSQVSIWDISTKSKLKNIELLNGEYIQSVSFDKKNSVILVLNDSKLQKIDYVNNAFLETYFENEGPGEIGISPSDDLLLLSGVNASILDINDFSEKWTLNEYSADIITKKINLKELDVSWKIDDVSINDPYVNNPAKIAFLPELNQFMIAGHNKGVLEVFDFQRFHKIKELKDCPIQVSKLVVDIECKYVAVAGLIPKGLFVWELKSGERIRPDYFNEEFGIVYSLGFLKDQLITGSSGGYLEVFDLKEGKELFSQRIHKGAIRNICVSNVYNKIFSGGDDGAIFIIS